MANPTVPLRWMDRTLEGAARRMSDHQIDLEVAARRERLAGTAGLYEQTRRVFEGEIAILTAEQSRRRGTEVEDARQEVSRTHPDHGGTPEQFIAAKKRLKAAKAKTSC